MEFNDGFPQYEMMSHHSEEAGSAKRRKIWIVFGILLAVTLLELYIGFEAEKWGLQHDGKSGLTLKVIFIGLTLFKAAYIVLSFMHLGDEKKWFRYTILVPYIFFILYLCFIVLTEGTYSHDFRAVFDTLFLNGK